MIIALWSYIVKIILDRIGSNERVIRSNEERVSCTVHFWEKTTVNNCTSLNYRFNV